MGLLNGFLHGVDGLGAGIRIGGAEGHDEDGIFIFFGSQCRVAAGPYADGGGFAESGVTSRTSELSSYALTFRLSAAVQSAAMERERSVFMLLFIESPPSTLKSFAYAGLSYTVSGSRHALFRRDSCDVFILMAL